jgi:hypothetical protein
VEDIEVGISSWDVEQKGTGYTGEQCMTLDLCKSHCFIKHLRSFYKEVFLTLRKRCFRPQSVCSSLTPDNMVPTNMQKETQKFTTLSLHGRPKSIDGWAS